jgi:hypothetical protein
MPDTPNTLRAIPERDEAEGYRPVSPLAVAALIVSGLTALLVVSIWIIARARGRPILVPAVLFAAVGGLALAVAAGWQVRRSEGTRTGLRLARGAFWLSVFSLGGYGAYFLATDLAVRQQARDVADRMFAQLAEGKPELAFRLTRPPAQQRGIEPDADKIRARFGSTDLFHFTISDLARIFTTWPADKVRVQFVGERDRQSENNGFVIHLNYLLRTPEGEFNVGVATRGVDDPATGGRDWQVVWNQTGVMQERRLTKLGRMCLEVQVECARRFLQGFWIPNLPRVSNSDLNAILRIEGNVPKDGEREQLAEDVKRPDAINPFPGTGMTRGPGLPVMVFSPEGVRLRMVVEVNAPSVDKNDPKMQAVLTFRVTNEALEKELLRLAGPDWEKEPATGASADSSPELTPYGLNNLFRVTELNLRPTLPRIAEAPKPRAS